LDFKCRFGREWLESTLESTCPRRASRRKVTAEEKLEVMGMLMNLEMRNPGLLKGKLDPGFKWPQYQEVQKLFSELERTMGFWY
jgi:hypothetical protein